jgi:hypothetical protein
MIKEDLQYIFKSQIDAGNNAGIKDMLMWFMLTDGKHTKIDRHPMDDLDGLLPMLSSFQYTGNEANMPRFSK